MTKQHNMHNTDEILEEMTTYICDKRCRYPYEVEQEELDAICEQCALSSFTDLLRGKT